jgi:hypothetical protein
MCTYFILKYKCQNGANWLNIGGNDRLKEMSPGTDLMQYPVPLHIGQDHFRFQHFSLNAMYSEKSGER